MKYFIAAGLAFAALAGQSVPALACNPLLSPKFGKHVPATVLPAAMLAKNHPAVPGQGGIVGLWHDVRTASDGSFFMEGFETWNRDGTETELGNLLPSTGDVCLGGWKKSGGTIDLLGHVAWLYDTNGNYIGTIDITQQGKLSADGNSYSGPFDAKFMDTTGVVFMEITGTTNAEKLAQ